MNYQKNVLNYTHQYSIDKYNINLINNDLDNLINDLKDIHNIFYNLKNNQQMKIYNETHTEYSYYSKHFHGENDYYYINLNKYIEFIKNINLNNYKDDESILFFKKIHDRLNSIDIIFKD